MDEIDKKILQMLQENARYSLKKIAESTFLSSPAVSSRIGKLEREDIITGYHAAVDPVKLGYHITAYVNLDVLPGEKLVFYERMAEIPNVLECSCVTGDYSMLLKVAFSAPWSWTLLSVKCRNTERRTHRSYCQLRSVPGGRIVWRPAIHFFSRLMNN